MRTLKILKRKFLKFFVLLILPVALFLCDLPRMETIGSTFMPDMIGQEREHIIDLDTSDRVIDIKVLYQHFIGPFPSHISRTISIEKGTEAALCFHLGGESS